MTEPRPFYITTPIYYGNARPHLGTLYSTVLADVLARHAQLSGQPVRFLTGTDEHGLKIAQAAQRAGMDVQPFVDAAVAPFVELFKLYGISYTDFMRTTASFHIAGVQEWITRLMAQGDIYRGIYEGWYCVPCETFVTVKDTVTSADQEHACPSCSRPLELLRETCYFFKLSAYQDRLLQWYQQHPDWVLPRERLAEVVSFVSSGLKDLAISRSRQAVQWGIPFPGDDAQLVYVWADALNNYITALGYGQDGREAELARWWPASFQVMGKDIIRFHAIYWPSFLMAAGLPLPDHLLVHGWIKVGADKMSKSLGNAVDPVQLAQQYGVDAVRYYLVRYLAITHDAPFSYHELQQRINADLANDIGNLVNRVLVMAHKYGATHVSVVPDRAHPIVNKIHEVIDLVLQELALGRFHTAYQYAGELVKALNAHIHAVQPWVLAKHDLPAAQRELGMLVYGLDVVSVLFWPVMPELMQTLAHALGNRIEPSVGNNIYHDCVASRTRTYTLGEPFVLYARQELSQTMVEDAGSTSAPAPVSSTAESNSVAIGADISFDHFAQVKLAVGTIIEVQEIPKSDKLYELTVDFGPLGTRTILSGIRKYFAIVDILGKQATFVLNLAPRAMMGKQSHGMLLTAKTQEGGLAVLAPATVGVANGTILS